MLVDTLRCLVHPMRLLTFRLPGDAAIRLGLRVEARVLDVAAAASAAGLQPLPGSLKTLLAAGPDALARLRHLATAATRDAPRFAGAWRDLAAIRHLPPIGDADKFLCVGKNYRTHLEELKRTNLIKEIPQEPTAFVKLNSSLVG